jgi:hypothetical protein
MSKKISTKEKYEKVVSDLAEGRFKTIDLACKFHDMSPASYHIYRGRSEGTTPTASTTPKPRAVRESPPTASSYSSGNEEVRDLRRKVEILEEQNKKLKETLMSLLK